MMLCLLYTAFFTTYQCSFPIAPHHEDTVLAVDLGVMAFFILDFIMRFNIAYVSEHTGVLVTDRHKIAKKYFMSGWLVLDFVSTVPW